MKLKLSSQTEKGRFKLESISIKCDEKGDYHIVINDCDMLVTEFNHNNKYAEDAIYRKFFDGIEIELTPINNQTNRYLFVLLQDGEWVEYHKTNKK